MHCNSFLAYRGVVPWQSGPAPACHCYPEATLSRTLVYARSWGVDSSTSPVSRVRFSPVTTSRQGPLLYPSVTLTLVCFDCFYLHVYLRPTVQHSLLGFLLVNTNICNHGTSAKVKVTAAPLPKHSYTHPRIATQFRVTAVNS